MSGFLLKHSLRVSAARTSSWADPGWIPKLGCTLMGPIAEGAQLVWDQSGPDGQSWFEHRVDVPQLAEEEGRSFVMQPTTADIDIAAIGECPFTLRLVDELVGLDRLLHTGTFAVTEASSQDWTVGFEWLQPLGLLSFDVDADTDAPKLSATVFLPGQIDTYQIVALLFRGGELVRRTSEVRSGWTFTSSRGNVSGTEYRVTFEDVRAWNNLRESGWGADFFTLDTNPGDYELRVAVDREVVRVIGFTIRTDGQLEASRIEPDVRTRPTAWIMAEQRGSLPAVDAADLVDRPAYGGDLATAALVWSNVGMYWYAATPAAEEDPAVAALAAELAELAESAGDMLQRWESDMHSGLDTSIAQYQQEYYLDQCRAAIDAVQAWQAQRATVAAPDETEIEVLDDIVTLAAAAERAATMATLAGATLARAAGSAEQEQSRLDAYRTALRGDKLAIFLDRPIPEFEYLTTDKTEISSPEELAAAEFWYFEGVADIDHEVQVDGSSVAVSTRGWRVLGFRFADDHSIVDRFEDTGVGSRSPVTAYQHARATSGGHS